MTSSKPSLSELEPGADFIARHIGPNDQHVEQMLKTVGAKSLDQLIDDAVPATIRTERPLDLPAPLGEREALSVLRKMAERNEVLVSMIGMGYSGTVMPNVILRRVLENPGWYTAYTPYQAEISQGRLEALMNFQQTVCDLTGLDLSNASLLDEATAAAEAMAMARRMSRSKSNTFFVDADTHPQTLAVLRTRAGGLGIEVVTGDPLSDLGKADVFAALMSYPGSSGEVRDFTPVIEALHEAGALAVMACDLLSLTLLTPPGELGADIAIGSAQRFGVAMGFGGPHAGFMASTDAGKRSMPGRIIGVSLDRSGRPAYRMALQTREQHIRRDKANSNICTAQVLLAVIAGFYAVYHGPDGLKRIARRVHRLTAIMAEGLRRLGVEVATKAYFDTLTVVIPGAAGQVLDRARAANINLRYVDGDRLGISLDETTSREEIERLWACFADQVPDEISVAALDTEVSRAIPEPLRRTSTYLTHEVFHSYRDETRMLRYLYRLQSKDIALDRSMIPLGSCTMKLNATTEMEAVTWRNFAHMHPFAPRDQTAGYHQLFEDIETWLCECTGFEAVSLQPNAGSQGEYAGLLAIRKYHEARGEAGRNICLIPTSAHGTNPASAVLAGLKVQAVACDEDGNIDVEDLRKQARENKDTLAALMVTYPSTHGVFEVAIREICEIIHEFGGQVYFDGANLNALLGIVRPGEIGADVAHMNLHKTFCIPHGGGGPGVGPIGVKAHLAPYLPDHAVVAGVNPVAAPGGTMGEISAAPYGSPSILPITWAYIAMMGAKGLRRATEIAILNANYIAKRLGGHYPVLYTGPGGYVAHECIIDIRQIKEACGIAAEDVAKRLMDYGFHAPTMSFPVADTLMIEPTESEGLEEIDRFCDAMIAIRAEIAEVESGQVDAENNLLRNAPHTQEQLIDEWTFAYDRARAFFPLGSPMSDKYWPPVGRIDNVYGDRNLVCTCPPMEAYSQAAE